MNTKLFSATFPPFPLSIPIAYILAIIAGTKCVLKVLFASIIRNVFMD